MMIPLGVVIVAVIVVPWYAALYHEHGWTYIKSFFISENVERFTSGVGVRQHRGPWFYLPIVLSDSFPWSLLLPCAAVAAWKTRTRIETLLWCWIMAIVGFFSLSAGKQDLYIFPIVSAVAGAGRRHHRARAVGRAVEEMGAAARSPRPARCWRWPAPRCCICSRPPAASMRSTRRSIVGAIGARRRRRGAASSAPRGKPRGRRAVAPRRGGRRRTGRSSCACCRSSSATSRSRQFSRVLAGTPAAGRRRRALPGRRCRAWCTICAGTSNRYFDEQPFVQAILSHGRSTRCCRPTTTADSARRSAPGRA